MLTHEPPVIGVISCTRAVEGEPAQAVKHRYLEAVARHAHAVPLIVPTNQPVENAAAIVARLDAVLLTGSNSNISPQRYGSREAHIGIHDAARDDLSTALIHAAIAAGKPLFGVCRGLQEINVALGGTLVDMRARPDGGGHHAPDDADIPAMFAHAHEVTVGAGTMLHRVTGFDHLTVNSVHYQAIDRLAEGLISNATSPDGVIEAVWASDTSAPVFAVQWHPEWRPDERAHDVAFWNYLGEAARSEYMPAPAVETA